VSGLLSFESHPAEVSMQTDVMGVEKWPLSLSLSLSEEVL